MMSEDPTIEIGRQEQNSQHWLQRQQQHLRLLLTCVLEAGVAGAASIHRLQRELGTQITLLALLVQSYKYWYKSTSTCRTTGPKICIGLKDKQAG
jgi:hypothetical protein